MVVILWPNGSTTRPPIASGFGPRVAPKPGASKDHKGTDFTGYGTVRAIADGTVTHVGTPSGWEGGGVQVWIQHDGFRTRSMHLAKGSTLVSVGDKVRAGDGLGTMGMTGTATGVHHHLEVIVNGEQIDPVPFITARLAATTGGTSTPVPVPTLTEIGEEMFIANCENGWFLVVPQGGGKPRAVVLDGDSGADKSGIPVLKFRGAGSMRMLTAAVQF